MIRGRDWTPNGAELTGGKAVRLSEWLDRVNERNNMEWQPIETAPKDKPILTYGRIPEDYGYCPEEWKISISHWCEAGRSSGWSSQGSTVRGSFVPTHWMPLPAPPAV